MIRLITHWYEESNPIRRHELLTALQENATNPFITAFVVLDMSGNESEQYVDPRNSAVVPVDHRPTFSEMAIHGSSSLSDINVIINTDCYIEHADTPLLETLEQDQAFCISRVGYHIEYSQDCWAWRGELKVEAAFHMGIPGCDNHLAKLMSDAGLTPINPCKSIRIVHLHDSGVRNYSGEDRMYGGYLYVAPCAL